MSTSVDNRIVQMTFDNKQFEQAIKQSMDSLKDLDKSINDAGTGKASLGLKNFIKALKDGISFDQIANSVESIKDRFTSMGIVGMTVIQNLTNSAINLVKRGLSAVNNALFGGGWQRAANLEQAEFRLEGIAKKASVVKAVMEDVDWAVTGTAYGLDEAAAAASMLFATGVHQGEEMRTTLRGITGVASVFSADFRQVSDIFTDAAASGNMMNYAMKRLQMVGVPARKVMADFLNTTVDNVKKMASEGKISFEEFAKAMDDAYGAQSQKANKTFTGALANMKTALKRMTAPFFTSFRSGARDAFNELRNLINEFGSAIQKQLPEFQSFISNTFSGIIDVIKQLSKANYIVTDLGKKIKRPSEIKKLGYVITGTIKAISIILQSIKKGFDNVFSGSAYSRISSVIDFLFKLEEGFLHWAKSQTIVEKISTSFFRVLEFGINVFKIAAKVVNELMVIFGHLYTAVQPIIAVIQKMTSGFLTFVDVFVQAMNKFDILGRIGRSIKEAATVVQTFLGTLFKTLVDIIGDFSGTAIESIDKLMDIIVNLGIFNWLVNFTDLIKKLTKTAGEVTKFVEQLKKAVDVVLKIPSKIAQVLNETRKALVQWQKQLKAMILLQLAGAVLMLAIGLKTIGKLDGTKIAQSLGAIVGLMTALIIAMTIWTKVISPKLSKDPTKGLDSLFSTLRSMVGRDDLNLMGAALIKFSVAVLILAKAIETIGKLTIGQAAQGFVGVLLTLAMLIAVAKLLSTNDRLLDRKRLTKGLFSLIFMAISLKIMASAITDLAQLSWEQLKNAIIAMSVVLGEIIAFSMLMSMKTKGLEGGSSAKSFIMFAVSMKIMANALASLADISWDGLQNALAAMGMVLFEIGVFSAIMGQINTKGAASFIGVSLGILLIAKALGEIALIPWETLNNSLSILIALLVTLGGVMALAAFTGKGAVALIAMAIALNLLIIPLAVLSGIPIDNLAMALLTLVTTLTVVAIAMGVFSAALVPMLIGALALTAAAVAVSIFAAALAALGLAFTTVGAGLTFIASGILAIYTVIKKIISEIVGLIGSFIEKIKDFFTGSDEEINKGGEKMANTSSQIGGKIASALTKAISKKISKVFSSFRQSGIKIITNLVSGMKSKVSQAPQAIRDAIEKAKSKVVEYVGKFKTAGGDIVKGIANGISNGASHIFSAVGSIATRALNKFKEKLGIGSPSKEFAKASRWIPVGAAKGVKKASDVFFGAVNNMADEGVSSFTNAMNNALKLTDINDDFNPVITPVLDLSDVKKDASQIGSIFDRNRLSASLAAGVASIDGGSPLARNINALASSINKLDKNQNGNNSVNYFTFNVDGAQNPEDFAYRLMRSLEAGARVM